MEEEEVLAFAVLIHSSALIDQQQQSSPDRIPNVFNMQIDSGNCAQTDRLKRQDSWWFLLLYPPLLQRTTKGNYYAI